MEWAKKREELKQAGVEEGVLFLQDLLPVGRSKDLNVCNHRKFIIIDGITCILGSLNIGDQYLYDTPVVVPEIIRPVGSGQGVPKYEEQWHDGCIRIQGAFILPVNRLFRSQWIVLNGDLFDPADSFYYPDMERKVGEERCTLITCFPGNPVNLIQQYFISLMSHATSETLIVNPYLICDVFWDTLKSIGKEASRHLSICNSLNVNDHKINKLSIRCNMYMPFRNGVSFYDYSKTGRFSHWKITYEERTDCVFHGSFNLNTRSALHDFEMGVLIKSKRFAEKAKALIDFDLACSEKILNDKLFFKYPRLHPSNYLNDATKYFS
jgi:cardiolipin synthase